MKLSELSKGYLETALILKEKLKYLRKAKIKAEGPEERAAVKHDLATLGAILTQCYDLAELTAHYYDRGYKRNDKYTL